MGDWLVIVLCVFAGLLPEVAQCQQMLYSSENDGYDGYLEKNEKSLLIEQLGRESKHKKTTETI